MMKSSLVLLALVSLAGCAHPGVHITDEDDAWITIGEQAMYCKANNSEKDAKPVCYSPERK